MDDDNDLSKIYQQDDHDESQELVLTEREEVFLNSVYEFIIDLKARRGTLQGSIEEIWEWVDRWYKFMMSMEEEGDESFNYEEVKRIIGDYINGLEG